MPLREFSSVQVGDQLPERVYPLTRQDLVNYAGVSGDLNPIHWDDEIAKMVGLDTAIAHGMLTMGIGGGYVYGQYTGSPEIVAAPGQTPESVRGAMSGRAVDPESGARMVVAVLPTSGWVRLSATVEGIPPGERCQMVVVGKDGAREVAFSWLTGDAANAGQPLSGSALVAPENVAAVEVQSEDGRTFVRVPINA